MKKKKQPLNRSEIMSRVKSKDTQVEIHLRKALWHQGYRYRKNDRSVFGIPDIVFKRKKVAIFCDSEFWHGKDYLEGKVPKTNSEYWIKKFEKNIKRDKQVNTHLKDAHWTVLRFWEKDIENNLESVINEIKRYL